MGGIPSKPQEGRTLQVIGAGYSRTGTVSMQMALERLLGGPVMHGATAILGREDAHCRKWVQAYRAKRAGDFSTTCRLVRELTAGFVAVTDMPPLDFVPELMAAYPDARVVLATRDPDAWLRSIAPVARDSSLWWLPWFMWPIPGWRWFPALSAEFGTSTKEYLGMDVEGGPRNPAPSTKLLLNWNARVQSLVPPEKLLVMDVKDGWQPLCAFLDVPVPKDVPFPRANDAAAAGAVAEEVASRVRVIWMNMFAAAGMFGVVAWKVMGKGSLG